MSRFKPVDAGGLDTRVAPLEPQTFPDGLGGRSTSYVPRAALWGRLEFADPGIADTEALNDRLVRATLWLRPGSGIMDGWRLLAEGRTFRVESVVPATRTDPLDRLLLTEIRP